MSIYKENTDPSSAEDIAEREPVTELVEPEALWFQTQDGSLFRAAMLLDKDGNETEVLADAAVILARSNAGEWYEVDIQEGSWVRPTLH